MTTNLEDIYTLRSITEIETSKGAWFDIQNPRFDIEEIAHALSNTCRWGGHCNTFYSVAEHSVLVSLIVSHQGLGDPLTGLLHDATEAFLSDVPAPFKQLLPDWKGIDAELEKKLYKHFHLDYPKSPGIKTADWIAAFIEARDLMPSKGLYYQDPEGVRDLAHKLRDSYFWVEPQSPEKAKKEFLYWYDRLRNMSCAVL
jgi:5'-deoxynucleotidase YfbR-like HD superfamily hydrolase